MLLFTLSFLFIFSVTQNKKTLPKVKEYNHSSLRQTAPYNCYGTNRVITNFNTPEYLAAKELNTSGFNPFDLNDTFFTDPCLALSKDNKDYTRSLRVNTYYINSALFCDSNYLPTIIDFDSNIIHCKCQTNPIVNDSLEEINNANKTEYLKTIGTYDFALIALCYKLVITPDILFNWGSSIFLSIIFLALLNLIVFAFRGMHPIRCFFLNLYRVDFIQQDPTLVSNQHFKLFSYNTASSRNISSSEQLKSNNKNKNSNLFEVGEVNQSKIKYSREKLDDMDFENLLLYDQRGFCSHYCDYLLIIHPLLKTFCASTVKTHMTIKLAKFLLKLSLTLGSNAFLYFERYIVHHYSNPGYIHVILYNWPIILYSFAFVTVMSFLLNVLTYTRAGIRDVRVVKLEKKLATMEKFLTLYKVRLGFFFVIQFIFYVAFWYYVTIFYTLYPNIMIKWLMGSAATILIKWILPFLFALLFAMAITLSINQRRVCWFNLVKISTYYS